MNAAPAASLLSSSVAAGHRLCRNRAWLAALTIATLVMSVNRFGPVFTLLSLGFLMMVLLVVATLTVKTLIAMGQRQICAPE